MSQAPPSEDAFTAERYLALVEAGVLGPEDKVELLEGVIVGVAPQGVRHAAAIARATHALIRVAGDRAHIRPQLPFIAGEKSVPEPDLALVSGPVSVSDRGHPRQALLVIEVAESSVAADRLTKSRIYAAAGVPEYWIVNLRDDRIEVARAPDIAARCYLEHRIARVPEWIELAALCPRATPTKRSEARRSRGSGRRGRSAGRCGAVSCGRSRLPSEQAGRAPAHARIPL